MDVSTINPQDLQRASVSSNDCSSSVMVSPAFVPGSPPASSTRDSEQPKGPFSSTGQSAWPAVSPLVNPKHM